MKKIIDKITFNINNYNVMKDGMGRHAVLFMTGPVAYSEIILKEKHNYKLTIYNNSYNLGLRYNNLNIDYRTLFKKHYTNIENIPIVGKYRPVKKVIIEKHKLI